MLNEYTPLRRVLPPSSLRETGRVFELRTTEVHLDATGAVTAEQSADIVIEHLRSAGILSPAVPPVE